MLPTPRSRRRRRNGAFLCAVLSALLLLLFLSLSLLHRTRTHHPRFLRHHDFNYDTLLSDSVNDDASSSGEDIIDALDVLDDDPPPDDADEDEDPSSFDPIRVSGGFFFYHISGAIRRAFGNKRSAVEWDGGGAHEIGLFPGPPSEAGDDRSKAAFDSDDVPAEESVLRKVVMVRGVEDALLLKIGRKVSPLREGWGDWFDKKGDFLRKDKMLRSNLEGLNPLHDPILQDPDGVGYSGLTKGDKILHKAMMNEFKKVPFLGRKVQESRVQGSSRHG